jgi:hypothetical protein
VINSVEDMSESGDLLSHKCMNFAIRIVKLYKWLCDEKKEFVMSKQLLSSGTMKEMGMEYSMSSFKSQMTNIYLVKRIFKASGYTPNRTLISKIFKDLSGLQRIAA